MGFRLHIYKGTEGYTITFIKLEAILRGVMSLSQCPSVIQPLALGGLACAFQQRKREVSDHLRAWGELYNLTSVAMLTISDSQRAI